MQKVMSCSSVFLSFFPVMLSSEGVSVTETENVPRRTHILKFIKNLLWEKEKRRRKKHLWNAFVHGSFEEALLTCLFLFLPRTSPWWKVWRARPTACVWWWKPSASWRASNLTGSLTPVAQAKRLRTSGDLPRESLVTWSFSRACTLLTRWASFFLF